MTLTTGLLVGAGTTTGCILRYSTGRLLTHRLRTDFPWGTFVVNIIGSFLLGIFFREIWMSHQLLKWWVFLGTGFCGGFTTFSTMSIETVQLLRFNRLLAVFYVCGSIGIGGLLAWLPIQFL